MQTYSEVNQTLFAIIELAILRQANMGKIENFGTEENKAKFGNVEFWKNKEGNWVYSLPTSLWDSQAVTKDLQYWF